MKISLGIGTVVLGVMGGMAASATTPPIIVKSTTSAVTAKPAAPAVTVKPTTPVVAAKPPAPVAGPKPVPKPPMPNPPAPNVPVPNVPVPTVPPKPGTPPVIKIPHIDTPAVFTTPAHKRWDKTTTLLVPFVPLTALAPRPYYVVPGNPAAHAPALSFADAVVAAQDGNVNAQIYLGEAYLYGRAPGGADPEQAVQWYTRAAEAGDGRAMLALAQIYEDGRLYGVEMDLAAAFTWKKKAADTAGVPEIRAAGRSQVCAALLLGRGVESDTAAALPYCLDDGQTPTVLGHLALGRAFEYGLGRPKDAAQALEHYRLAADSGVPMALVEMGRVAHEGLLIPRDDQVAFEWYSKAAAAHSLMAAEPLAQMYENGRGTAADPQMAEWLHRLGMIWGDPAALDWGGAHPADPAQIVAERLTFKQLAPPWATAAGTDANGAPTTVTFQGLLSGGALADYYPPRAQDNEVEGASELVCRVTAEHRLGLCFLAGEYPMGYGFGPAMIKFVLRHDWQLPATDLEGRDTAGRSLAFIWHWRLG